MKEQFTTAHINVCSQVFVEDPVNVCVCVISVAKDIVICSGEIPMIKKEKNAAITSLQMYTQILQVISSLQSF